MQIDRAKLRAVILYIMSACEKEALGPVRLNKILYLSDMLHFVKAGTPITGATYRKRPFGPACDQLLWTLRDMSAEGEIEIFESDYFGYIERTFVPLKRAEADRLNHVELSLLDEMIDFVCRNNVSKPVSTFILDRAWEMVDFGEEMPYKSALYILPSQVSPEAMEWASKEVARVDSERSETNAMGNVSFIDFRSRVLQARSG